MNDLFNQWGNFLFHTRNVLFPVLVVALLFLFPPVAIGTVPGDYLLAMGLLMVTAGQVLRILTIGLAYIVRGGRHRRIYAENLVTDGVFAHCRNPLYVGNILIVMGFMFIAGNTTGLILGSLAFMVIYRLIVFSEERFLTEKFGQAYLDFCNDVPRWLPRLQGLRATISNFVFDWPAVAVKEYGTLFRSLMISLGLISWKLNLAGSLAQNKTPFIAATILIVSAYAIVRFLKKTERLRSMR
ncbi:methyltransferase family protein [Methylobacter sp.]|jgi:protein-S-isoprenylcysteine O-methyltransferase Ste14|uniref:methyltransferase family protein n=1 Tax=Methylobacter sp. TaxID=2051955 RepID=UPI003DA51D3D